MNKNDYHIEFGITDNFFIYNLVSCSDYVRAGFFKRESENQSKYIGDITCLNSPSEDGTNPHWKIYLDIVSEENKGKVISKKLLKQLTTFLEEKKYLSRPMWVEGREYISKEGFEVGELWNDD